MLWGLLEILCLYREAPQTGCKEEFKTAGQKLNINGSRYA